uniref:Uncharacterized protein n=1 Tax=Leptobrachium leishanense TaxID=445787 RepID=A0A8C5LPE9_9ANUR
VSLNRQPYPLPVSFPLHTAMLSLLSRPLDWFRSLFGKEEMKLTLVGLQHLGKPRVSGQFSEDLMPTVGCNMRKVTKDHITIKICDIGGQPRFRSIPVWFSEIRDLASALDVVIVSYMASEVNVTPGFFSPP